MTVNDKQQLIDFIYSKVLDRANCDPTTISRHMSMFQWGSMAKKFGKQKRFEKEARETISEFLNGSDSDTPSLDLYLRAIGLDGYEIMMKIMDYKKRPANN